MSQPTVANRAFGGNAPPVTEIIDQDYGDLFKRAADWITKAEAIKKAGVPATEADERAMVEIVGEGKRLSKEIEDTRLFEGGPLTKTKRELDGYFNGKNYAVTGAQADLQNLIGQAIQRREAAARAKALAEAQLAAERQRKAEEAQAKARSGDQAAKKAAEAEAAAEQQRQAEAAAAQKAAPVRGGGVTISTRKVWDFEITDLRAIPLDDLRPFFGRDAIEKAIRGLVKVHKGDTDLAGVRVFEKSAQTVRT